MTFAFMETKVVICYKPLKYDVEIMQLLTLRGPSKDTID